MSALNLKKAMIRKPDKIIGSNMKCSYIIIITRTALTVRVDVNLFHKKKVQYRTFSHNVTAAILASRNNKTADMLVY